MRGEWSVDECASEPGMIDSIEIRNFRSFSASTVSGCKRINIIVGENGSGKTALLEGAFLASAPSPEAAIRNRIFRGYENERFMGTPQQVDHALWGDLFHNFNTSKAAHVKLFGYKSDETKGGLHDTRSVTITFEEQKRQKTPKRLGGLVIPQQEQPITFEWKAPNGFVYRSSPVLENGAIKIGPDRTATSNPPSFLLTGPSRHLKVQTSILNSAVVFNPRNLSIYSKDTLRT